MKLNHREGFGRLIAVYNLRWLVIVVGPPLIYSWIKLRDMPAESQWIFLRAVFLAALTLVAAAIVLWVGAGFFAGTSEDGLK